MKTPAFLVTLALLLFANNSLSSPQCIQLLNHNKKTELLLLEKLPYVDMTKVFLEYTSATMSNSLIRLAVRHTGIDARFIYKEPIATSDTSLLPFLLSVLKLPNDLNFTEYSASIRVERSLSKEDVNSIFHSLHSAVTYLESLTNHYIPPNSLNKPSKPKFSSMHQDYKPELSKPEFNNLYRLVFMDFTNSLPLAMQVAFRTEYYLEEVLPSNSVAVKMTKQAYDLNTQDAKERLKSIYADFINALTVYPR